jgi:hypothetical protein
MCTLHINIDIPMNIYECKYRYSRAYTHAHTHARMYVYICTYIHTNTHTNIHKHKHTMNIDKYICIYIYIYNYEMADFLRITCSTVLRALGLLYHFMVMRTHGRPFGRVVEAVVAAALCQDHYEFIPIFQT